VDIRLRPSLLLTAALACIACGHAPDVDDGWNGGDGPGAAVDSDAGAGAGLESDSGGYASYDSGRGASDGATTDAGSLSDAGSASDATSDASPDAGVSSDSGSSGDAGSDTSPADTGSVTSVITGGPCLSGAAGQAAYRVHWIDAGGRAQVVYEVNGLPDKSRDHTGTYGYQIGFTSEFGDPFLGPGGDTLDPSDFIDIELSTLGVSSISKATLALYGRSYDTTTNGSFQWQSFTDFGEAPTDLMSNVTPYAWYTADLGMAIAPNDGNVLLRVKAGPSSDSLVVNRLEICIASP
jgi:hypothetical protein